MHLAIRYRSAFMFTVPISAICAVPFFLKMARRSLLFRATQTICFPISGTIHPDPIMEQLALAERQVSTATRTISAAQVRDLLLNREEIALLDVREEALYATG